MGFKYDVKVLIQGVKDRPCLWNKNLEVYKDRLERRNAWEEIFNLLDESYESLPSEERRLIGEHVINKWTNIRDTFVKSLKTKMGKPKRRYMLHDQMKFLLNGNYTDEQEYDEESNIPFMKEELEIEEETPVARKRSKRQDSDESYKAESSYSSKKRTRKETSESKSRTYDDTSANDPIDFVGIEENEQRLMNEDEAFFASLLPTVVKYSEDERLEFRIEVLGLMKRIKDNRKWNMEDS